MRRSWLLLPVGVAALLASLFLGGQDRLQGAAAPASPDSPKVLACGTCHSMEQEVAGWEAGAHKEVTCLQCHQEGDPGWVRHEFVEKNTDMASHTATELRKVHLEAPNERCLACHDKQLEMLKLDLTPPAIAKAAPGSPLPGQPMAIKAAHDLHLSDKAGLTCLDCHAGSAHGPASGTAAAKEQAHNACQNCHDQKQVVLKVTGNVTCSACHVDVAALKPAPSDHKELATQQADACLACHTGVPTPHETGFLARHGQEYLAAKQGTCENCHSPQQNPVTPAPAYATVQFCQDCHLQPMPHPAGFAAVHGAKAQQAPATCELCHSSQNPARPTAPHAAAGFCASCHNAYEHPTGWVAGHGTQVDTSCATCHTLQGQKGQHNACSTCHSADGTWHPDMWFINHAQEVEKKGKEACLTCHGEVEPSCTQCHREQ